MNDTDSRWGDKDAWTRNRPNNFLVSNFDPRTVYPSYRGDDDDE